MVTFTELRDADPGLWRTAADDLITVVELAERSVNDIIDRGTGPVSENWPDHVGDLAVRRLERIAAKFEAAGRALRGVSSTVDGLADSAEVVRSNLLALLDWAAGNGLAVSASGRIPTLDFTRLGEPVPPEIGEANDLIAEAVASATAIDDAAARTLDELGDVVVAIVGALADGDLDAAIRLGEQAQLDAATDQVDLIRAGLPVGAGPETVRAWWDGLSSAQRADYMRAVPVDLYDLQGIPMSVKDELVGTGGYDRVEAVRWARENWENPDIDIFENNCANFVSHALHNGGLDEKNNFWGGMMRDDTWGRDTQLPGPDWIDVHDRSHSASWTDSGAQRDFFLDNGGQEVTRAQAMPGDIVYFVHDGEGTDVGDVHHAALVTAVTPDGDIHYTQHTSSRLDASLSGRLPWVEVSEGDQRVVIVRPRQTW